MASQGVEIKSQDLEKRSRETRPILGSLVIFSRKSLHGQRSSTSNHIRWDIRFRPQEPMLRVVHTNINSSLNLSRVDLKVASYSAPAASAPFYSASSASLRSDCYLNHHHNTYDVLKSNTKQNCFPLTVLEQRCPAAITLLPRQPIVNNVREPKIFEG